MKFNLALKKSALSVLSCLTATALLAWAVSSLYQSVHAQSELESQSGATSTVNLKNVDIHTLIETVSSRSGKNFIVDPRVKATVTVVSSEPVDGDQLYELFLSVLDVHGLAAVQAGSFIKIVPVSVGVQSAVPLLDRQTSVESADDEWVTKILRVQNVPAQQLIESLRPLLPETASISAEANTNTLVITDRAANIARLTQIVRMLDGTQ